MIHTDIEQVDQASREALISLFEDRIHLPAMAAQPSRTCEASRNRLLHVQASILTELRLLRQCTSAEEVVSTFLAREASGALAEIDQDAALLGLPTLLDVLVAFRSRSRDFEAGYGRSLSGPAAVYKGRAARVHDAAADAPSDLKPNDDLVERQNLLLDEAIEETFPASDSVSAKRIV